MRPDIFVDARLYSVEHHRLIAVFVKQLPSDIGLQQKIGAGDIQCIFDSGVIPVRRNSVFIANLIEYLEIKKKFWTGSD